MFSFSIVESEVRDFTHKLLREEVFDFFEVRGAEIATFARFEINGVLDKDYLDDGCDRNYCTWSELRPHVFGMIKGRRPKSFKIVFSLPRVQAERMRTASAYFLNLAFDGAQVLCTATVAEKTFDMDRSVENVWQEFITEFFKDNKITIRRN